jgi:hypothetical protein
LQTPLKERELQPITRGLQFNLRNTGQDSERQSLVPCPVFETAALIRPTYNPGVPENTKFFFLVLSR